MSHKCISLTILLHFICISHSAVAQFSTLEHERSLLVHLRKERLYTERAFLLNNLDTDTTSTQLSLEKAWTSRAAGESDEALRLYKVIPLDSIFNYNFQHHYVGLLFQHEYGQHINAVKTILGKYPNDSTLNIHRRNVNLLELKYPLEKVEALDLPDPIFAAYRQYHLINKKSAFVATGLSVILPGSGKFYYHQYRPGLNMLFANAVLGIQAYESYRKSGLQSPRFIVFGGMFSFFYLSNIYGTFKGLRKIKSDRKKQLHYEISYYHYHNVDAYPGRY